MKLPSILDLIQSNDAIRIDYSNSGDEIPIIKLEKDEFGYYIMTVDNNFEQKNYTTAKVAPRFKSFISTYEKEVKANWSKVSWDDTNDEVYVQENEYLLHKLPADAVLVDSNNEVVKLKKDREVVIRFLAVQKDEFYSIKLQSTYDEVTTNRITIISESMAIVDSSLVLLSQSILNTNYVPSIINSKLTIDELPIVLSVIASYVSSDIVMSDYKNITLTNMISAKKTIIFDEVDEDNNMYIRISQTLGNIKDADVLEKYRLTKIVSINTEAKNLLIQPVQKLSDEEVLTDLIDFLRRQLSMKFYKRLGITPPKIIMDNEVALIFLTEILPNILDEYEIFGQEKLKKYKISASSPSINASLASGIDYLEGTVTLDFDGEVVDVFTAINMWKKNKYIQLKNGQNVLVAKNYIDKLERLFSKQGDKVKLSFFDLPIAEELLKGQLDSSVFKKHRKVFEGFNSIKGIRNSKKINATLRDYQKYGVAWMQYLHANDLNGCLADDMGLGKTLQALSLLALEPSKKPSLVIMPRTLLYNWNEEINKFIPGMSHHMYYGGDRNLEQAKKNNIILTTYGVVRNDVEKLKEIDFFYIILDESQNIKNYNAKGTKATLMLKSEHKLALSGTPMENNLGELYSLFRFLNPAMLGSEHNFQQKYLDPIQKYGSEEATLYLRKKIYPFILRRLKGDVLKELPEKIDNVIYIDQSPEQKKLYEQRRQFYKATIDQMVNSNGINQAQFFIFQAFAELRMLASIPEAKTEGKIKSPKLELLAEHMIRSILNGHKVLVFANFLAAVELINKVLDDHGIHYVSMTGSTSNRKKVVNEFKQNENCKAFVMTLKTGGTGLNLTEADIIYIFDPWWNVAAETQAIDRAHRIGQDKTVISYRLITKDSIEEKILELQNQKKKLFDSLLSSDASMTKSLSKEDIDYILK